MATYYLKTAFYGLTGLITAMALAADSNFGAEKQVEQAQRDLRMMDTGLQTFFIDNNQYPAWTTNTAEMAVPRDNADGVPSFRKLPPVALPHDVRVDASEPVAFMLTTPISYLSKYPNDPFTSNTQSTYAYLGDQHGFLVWSPGPDRKYDIKWQDFETTTSIPDTFKIMYTYDPSNGAISSGDIWRASTQH